MRSEAIRVEPRITALLGDLLEAERALEPDVAELVGLEHRLKKHSSLVRKITARMRTKSQSASDVDIVDALRYTARIRDRPPGSYVRVSHSLLASLESAGKKIVRVKNYWARGDNYSGVNVVVREGNGFQWEIQFHTPKSLEVRDRWHHQYTVLRDDQIDGQKRRAIYDEMTQPWNGVAIPEDVLIPGNLHATERLIRYPRP